MPQAIKYESTEIEAEQSAGEIARLVRRYGGSRFEMRWDEAGNLTGVRFALRVPDLGEVPVRLTAASETISGILLTNRPWSQRSRSTREEHARLIEAQAHRIAWRQLRDFVEQALLAVETGLFPIGSAFMAHMEVWDEQREETVTMAELVASRAHLGAAERGILLLPRGKARP